MALGSLGACEGRGCGNELGGSWSEFHGNIPRTNRLPQTKFLWVSFGLNHSVVEKTGVWAQDVKGYGRVRERLNHYGNRLGGLIDLFYSLLSAHHITTTTTMQEGMVCLHSSGLHTPIIIGCFFLMCTVKHPTHLGFCRSRNKCRIYGGIRHCDVGVCSILDTYSTILGSKYPAIFSRLVGRIRLRSPSRSNNISCTTHLCSGAAICMARRGLITA